MRVSLRSVIALACCSMACFAQAPQPTFTYTLHAHEEPRGWSQVKMHPYPALAVTPLGVLLVLIPQSEGKWVLKQLMDWSTPNPREQTLAITSNVGRNEVESIEPNLIVTRNGKYVVIRITTYRRLSYRDFPFQRAEASVIVVDWHTFSIMYMQTTTDPLIAGADWSLKKDDSLISRALTNVRKLQTQTTVTTTYDYEAALMHLPHLKPSTTCNYTQVREYHYGGEWKTKDEKTSGACSDVIQAAGVASVDDLPYGQVPLGGAKTRPRGCGPVSFSDDGRFELDWCSEDHLTFWDTYKTTSGSALVMSTADSATVLSIILKGKLPVTGTLASAAGHQYLILLRRGIYLEGYRLP